jgi:hypothetical protein
LKLAGTAIDNARLFEGLQIAHQRYQSFSKTVSIRF